MKTTSPTTPIIVGALAVASIIGATVFAFTQNSSPTTTAATGRTTAQTTTATPTTTAATDTTSTSTAATTSTSSSGYKDGTYTASASYSVPRGSNSIDVSVTVKNGVVTAVKATHGYSASDRESGMYVDAFDSSINSSVVGKAIDSITSLSRVGGASLTTYGFDDALATIANQAKA